jgi:hypothetical protein
MFGNVWEWCFDDDDDEWQRSSLATVRFHRPEDRLKDYTELRGGSYLDDLTRVSPFIDVRVLRDGINTRHSDLGFRVAATIPFQCFDEDARERLKHAKLMAPYDTPGRFEAAPLAWIGDGADDNDDI